MTERVQVVGCRFHLGYLIKALNAFKTDISVVYSLRFLPDKLVFEARSGNNRIFSSVTMDALDINLKWYNEDVKSRDINLDILGTVFKDGYKQIKKTESLGYSLFMDKSNTLGKTKNFILQLNPGEAAFNRDGYKNFHVKRRTPTSPLIIPKPDMKKIKIFTGAKKLGKQLSSFAVNRDVYIYMYTEGMIIRGDLKAKTGEAVERVGELHDEELIDFRNDLTSKIVTKKVGEINLTIKEYESVHRYNIGACISQLKALCGIYDSPIRIHYEVGKALAFVTKMSYLGTLEMFIVPQI
uniref:Putative divergent proliferating cell nuclear antigen n=1 Tax=Pithovirus LCDPAC01 TaxID=2506600 RepID=A0A481YQE1_9VIRU|nr:MAG: putative divergent proliferating cell nuclear antigen [Pithovirus LCDPAC01]